MENQNAKIDEMNELESVKALNEVSMELLRHKKADHTKLFVIIILLIVVNLIQCGLLVWLIIRDSDVAETANVEQQATQNNQMNQSNNVLSEIEQLRKRVETLENKFNVQPQNQNERRVKNKSIKQH